MMALSMAMVGETVSPGEDRQGDRAARHDVGDRHRARAFAGRSAHCGAGWRSIFLINLPLGLLAWWLAYRQLPEDRESPGKG